MTAPVGSGARIRRPVLLVPGWSDTARALQPCRAFLVAHGWAEEHVRCVGFRDPYGSNVEHAAEIADAIVELQQSTSAPAVDVVAHSMGGLALRRYLVTSATPPVSRTVFVATPHRGTLTAWVAWGRGAPEMRPGSAFLRTLETRPLPGHVDAYCLRTPIDTHVVPGTSAWLEGTTCLTVRTPIHQRMLRHRRTLETIRELLARP